MAKRVADTVKMLFKHFFNLNHFFHSRLLNTGELLHFSNESKCSITQGDNSRWQEIRKTAYLPYKGHRGFHCFVGPSLSRIVTELGLSMCPIYPTLILVFQQHIYSCKLGDYGNLNRQTVRGWRESMRGVITQTRMYVLWILYSGYKNRNGACPFQFRWRQDIWPVKKQAGRLPFLLPCYLGMRK